MIALLGDGLGLVAGVVLRVRRRHVEAAMARAGIRRPARHARAMYAGLGRGVLELLWLAGASARRRGVTLDAHVRLDPAARAAIERGPAVLCASHTGNWETAAAAAARVLAAQGRRLVIVGKPLSVGGVDAFCTLIRGRLGVEVIRPEGAFGAARDALRSGACVAMPIDQVPDRAVHGVVTDFLGAPALADRAPATLARRANVPIVVAAAQRDGLGQRVMLLAELTSPRDAAETERVTRAATAALERFVLHVPAAWLWLHRRWRTPPCGRRPAKVTRQAWTTRASSPLGGSRAA